MPNVLITFTELALKTYYFDFHFILAKWIDKICFKVYLLAA